MPSLREMALEAEKKRQEAAAKQAELAKAKELEQASKIKLVRVEKPIPVSPEISIDTLRGLYWLATAEHVGDKKATRGEMKRRLKGLLLTPAGMRTLLNSLEKHVFS